MKIPSALKSKLEKELYQQTGHYSDCDCWTVYTDDYGFSGFRIDKPKEQECKCNPDTAIRKDQE